MTENNSQSPQTRGVVVLDTDIVSLPDWPQLAAGAGLNTLGVGPGSIEGYLSGFLRTERGQAFVAACAAAGVALEHEMHGLQELLPRELFAKDPTMFRENEEGMRSPEWNCCAHSQRAMEIVCENAVRVVRELVSTTRRYFFWMDDARPMCRCTRCRGYSDSDQALMIENCMISALRAYDPAIQLAHLAYVHTLPAPREVKPEPGIFLEFAPIHRSYTQPLRCPDAHQEGIAITHAEVLDHLDANLAVFDRETAQVLEYWMDVSRFSSWKRPAVALPWNPEVFLDDLDTYTSRGIGNITCYAAWIDADYIREHGRPPLDEYAYALSAAAAAAATAR